MDPKSVPKISVEPWTKDISKLMKGTTVTTANPDNCIWFVAREDEKMVGACAVVLNGFGARIKSLVVLESHRGRGIGRALWDMRMKFLLGTRVRKVTGFASPYSQPMYLKAGFKLKRRIIRKDRETWFMELEL